MRNRFADDPRRTPNAHAMTAPSSSQQLPPGAAHLDIDRRKLRRAFPDVPKAREVYHMALEGKSEPEIRRALFPDLNKTMFRKRYHALVVEARSLHPDIFPHHRRYNGNPPHPMIEIDEAELRRKARTTAPDTIIAIHFKCGVKTLRERFGHIIDEERAKLGFELAEQYVAKARGKEAVTKEVDGKVVLVEPAVPPDTALGEKLLNRIGFMDAPIESEINVHVHFDDPPQRKPKGATVEQGRGRKLLDLGDDDDADEGDEE